MKKILFTITAIALLTVSCQKEFSVSDSSRISGSQVTTLMEQNPGFLSSYISGIYTYMVEFGNYNSSSHDDFGVAAIGMVTDFMCTDIAFPKGQHFGIYDAQHDYGSEEYLRPTQIWGTFYTLINKANEIIDFFGTEDPTNENLRNNLGQAYAIRAYAYTNLSIYFQDIIKTDGTVDLLKPGVPIIYAFRDGKSEDEKTAHAGRTPIGEVFSHIEFNIDKALPLLEGTARTSKNEVDFYVANGFAARYYLLSQQWEKAAEHAKVAQSNYSLMDNSRLHAGFNEINDEEVMWGFNHTNETKTVYASFFSHMSSYSNGYAEVFYKAIDKRLYDQMNVSDYRKSLFNDAEGDPDAETSVLQYPYINKKFGNAPNWLGDYIYMRAAEMYLIEAEGYARLGQTSQAQTVLNTLMITRDPAWNKTATVEEILLQRRLELWGEGFSYFDTIRNGLGSDRTGSNTQASLSRNWPAHDLLWFFQIPLREIQNNPNISPEEQTPLS